jgi:hypothetical protein
MKTNARNSQLIPGIGQIVRNLQSCGIRIESAIFTARRRRSFSADSGNFRESIFSMLD